MPDDPLSKSDDPLGAPMRLAMADVPPEVPPSGGFPPGKTKPSQFLAPTREPGGAPAPSAGKAKFWMRRGGEPSGQPVPRPPGASPASVADQIRAAFAKLAGTPAMDSVRFSALRQELAHIPRADLDRALLDMHGGNQAQLITLDNPRDIRSEGDAALKAGPNSYHSVWIAPGAEAPAIDPLSRGGRAHSGAIAAGLGQADASYIGRLENAVGTEAFTPIYEALKADKNADVVGIANQFYGPVAKSTSREKALGRILTRHRKVAEF